MRSKRTIAVKSVQQMTGQPSAHYRFTLTEEMYSTENQAATRVKNLFLKPPDPGGENEYTFALRKGYQQKNCVYVIGTDAVLFEKEMQRLAEELLQLLLNQNAEP